MNATHFTQAAVPKQLSTLNTAKGPGPDWLHPFMLQILADFLAEPIIALFYKSLQSGEIPQGWCKAIICPIFKKRDPEEAANNCFVIVTSVLRKIFKNCSKGLSFVSHRDTIYFTEPTWLPSPTVLLAQPSHSGITCNVFVGRKTRGGLKFLRLRKGVLLRQPSVSTSQADVFRHRWTCAELVYILPFQSIMSGPNQRWGSLSKWCPPRFGHWPITFSGIYKWSARRSRWSCFFFADAVKMVFPRSQSSRLISSLFSAPSLSYRPVTFSAERLRIQQDDCFSWSASLSQNYLNQFLSRFTVP